MLRAACCLCALGPHLQLAQHDLRNLTLATLSSFYLSTPSFWSPACLPARLPEPGSVMPMPIDRASLPSRARTAAAATASALLLLLLTTWAQS